MANRAFEPPKGGPGARSPDRIISARLCHVADALREERQREGAVCEVGSVHADAAHKLLRPADFQAGAPWKMQRLRGKNAALGPFEAHFRWSGSLGGVRDLDE